MQPHEPAEQQGNGSEVREDGLPQVTPDLVEQDYPDEIDNIVPTRGYTLLPMVGLGGSAGSMAALQSFLSTIPADTGMAFAVVVHLSPEHSSILPEILGRFTRMEVFAAQNGQPVKANCVYVIPPGKHLATVDGHLRLTDIVATKGVRVAVDLFFRSLADSHGPHAAAIVLSGADGDGALGIKRVKERGGLTIAQDPAEAEHKGMPQSAIATDMVDWVLPVAQMPAGLQDYFSSESRLRVPSEEGPQPAEVLRPALDEDETALRDVLAYLQTRTGRDFTYYKRATLIRRIARRMQVNTTHTLPSYLTFLRTHPGEIGALVLDLLISVTNFFRDRECFDSLEKIIPDLFRDKQSEDSIRVWVPACATGDEAYSIAILLLEHARTLADPPAIQVFGCDLDEAALKTARAGFYPEAIAADVSEERLGRFFTKEPYGWRIRRDVREVVLFATHDLLKDAPLSRMDLVSCRNLLIYLTPEAQKIVFDIFHFALKPRGWLFLGASESVSYSGLPYDIIEQKHRLYRQRPVQRTGFPVPQGPGTLLKGLKVPETFQQGPVLPGPGFGNGNITEFLPPPSKLPAGLSLNELHFRLVERLSPPSMLLNAEHEVVHLSERVGRFLFHSGGEPTSDVFRIVHPSLRTALRGAVYEAAGSGAVVEVAPLPVDLDGVPLTVLLRVSPANDLSPGFMLVTLDASEGVPGAAAEEGAKRKVIHEPVVRLLEREVESLRTRLRERMEQYEAGGEELKASNEELQAMNEELRSASEELETGREEMQSINEELTAVNLEHKAKIEELSRANSDLHNFMSATAIPTMFLDRELRIMRFTPGAAVLFRVIPGDLGRPLADLRHQLEYPELAADALRVLEHLAPVERELFSEGRWYLARLLPYRTLEDHIAGVVLTLVDITESKRATEVLRESESRQTFLLGLSDSLRTLADPASIQATVCRVLCQQLGADGAAYFEVEDGHYIVGHSYAKDAPPLEGRFPMSSFGPTIAASYRSGHTVIASDVASDSTLTLDERAAFSELHTRAYIGVPLLRDGEFVAGLALHMASPRHWTPHEVAVAEQTAERAWVAVERARIEEALRESDVRFRTMADTAPVLIWEGDESGATFVNGHYLEFFGVKFDEIAGTGWKRFLHPDDAESFLAAFHQAFEQRETHTSECRLLRADGQYRWMRIIGQPLGKTRFVGCSMDVTDQKRREDNFAFMASLAGDFSRHSTSSEILEAARARIVAHFGQGTHLYATCDCHGKEGHVVLCKQNAGDLSDSSGHLSLSEIAGKELLQQLKDGECVAIADMAADPRTSQWYAEHGSSDVRAQMLVPLFHEGRIIFLLTLQSGQPRDWLEDEMQLFQEITVRLHQRLDKVRSEEALRASEQRLKRMMNVKGVGIVTMDLHGKMIHANDAFLKSLGYSREAFESHAFNWRDFTPPEYVDETTRQLAGMSQTGLGGPYEKQYFRKDGSRTWLMIVAADLGDGTMVEYAIDINDRKRAENSLLEFQEQFRLVVENAREYAIFSLDLDRRIRSWNSGAQIILGYTPDEVIGQNADIIFTPEDRAASVPAKEAAIALTEGRANDERWHVRKDGTQFWASGVMMSMHGSDGAAIGLVKIFRDHTEQMKSREELNRSLLETDKARAEAEAAGRAKDHFLAILSHELRTPLTPIRMIASAQAMRSDLPEDLVEDLKAIERNVKMEAALIDDLLDVTRISRGTIELAISRVNLKSAIEEAGQVTRPEIELKLQTLTINMSSDDYWMQGDAARLRQVFWNLFRNSSKFTPDGGTISVEVTRVGSLAKVTVSDTGIGFEPDTEGNLFDPFVQASRRITQEYGGLGLGLSICKAIVEGHDGTITGESEGRDKGATFIVTLPLITPG